MAQRAQPKVKLNIGGHIFTTTLGTLTCGRSSMLATMFSEDFGDCVDEDGCYFIDNDGAAFHHVLSYLRHGKLIISDVELQRLHPHLMNDAQYYCVEGLEAAIRDRLQMIEQTRRKEAKKCEPEIQSLSMTYCKEDDNWVASAAVRAADGTLNVLSEMSHSRRGLNECLNKRLNAFNRKLQDLS